MYVGRPGAGTPAPAPTLGEHRPAYTPAYTYRKHLLEGRRYWHRGAPRGLRWRLGALEASPHPLAPLAQLALSHGIFLPAESDELKPLTDEPRAAWLHALLASNARHEAAVEGMLPLDHQARLSTVFRSFSGRDASWPQRGERHRDVHDRGPRRRSE